MFQKQIVVFKKGNVPHNKGKGLTEEERKEKKRKYAREYYKKNSKRLNEKTKGYYYKNIEASRKKAREKNQRFRDKNREEVNRKARERYSKNIQHYRDVQNKRNARNREIYNAKARESKARLKKGIYHSKPLSEEHKKKISKSTKGKIISDESRRKISIAGIGRDAWNKGTRGLTKAWNKGKTGIYSEETLRKLSAARAKQIFPSRDTKIEIQVQNILNKHKIPFVKHKNFKLSKSNHQVDILIEPNKVIEVNGDYWHFNPIIYDGNSVQKRRGKQLKAREVWKKDKIIYNELNKLGLSVLVVWESELKNSKDISKKIIDFVNK